jgi:hypothetical protein
VKFAEAPNDEATFEYAAALWASTDRHAVLGDMKAILRSRRQGVNKYFVQDLVQMEIYSEPKWRSAFEHRSDNFGKFEDDYLTELNRRVDGYTAEAGVKKAVTANPAKN